MIDEDKKELIEALCEYLPYGVYIDKDGDIEVLKNIKVYHYYCGTDVVQDIEAYIDFYNTNEYFKAESIKLILRPISSMTEQEYKEYIKFVSYSNTFEGWKEANHYLISHLFDYKNLIGKNIALKDSSNLYKY